jgi:hypothetical protein
MFSPVSLSASSFLLGPRIDVIKLFFFVADLAKAFLHWYTDKELTEGESSVQLTLHLLV